MQHEVGIRRGVGARFVLPGSHQRDLRSGSLGLFPVRSHRGQALAAGTASQPVRAIRLAARSLVRAEPRIAHRGAVLVPPDRTRWNPLRPRLRDPRGAATPWRG